MKIGFISLGCPKNQVNCEQMLWQTYEAHLADNAAFDGVKMLAVGMFGGGQLHHGSKTLTSPEDVANAVFLLCLPEASMINGHTLVVDGGYCISG